jgi:hypothetical protein
VAEQPRCHEYRSGNSGEEQAEYERGWQAGSEPRYGKHGGEPARPDEGAEQLVAGTPSWRGPEHDDSSDPAESDQNAADEQQNYRPGIQGTPAWRTSDRHRHDRVRIGIFSGRTHDVLRPAKPLQDIGNGRAGPCSDGGLDGPGLGYMHTELFDQFGSPVCWQASCCRREPVEVVRDEPFAGDVIATTHRQASCLQYRDGAALCAKSVVVM